MLFFKCQQGSHVANYTLDLLCVKVDLSEDGKDNV